MESKLIIENASEAIISVETTGIVSSWNKAAEYVFGCTGDEAIGKHLNEIIVLNSGNGGTFFSYLDQEEVRDTVVTFTRGDGVVVPFEFNVSMISSGNHSIYAIFARDVSNRWQREAELLNAYQKQAIINDILNVSLQEVSFDEQIEQILDLILSIPTIKLLPSGAILLTGEQPGFLYTKAQRGFSDQQIETCSKVPFGKCHCGRAALEGKIQFVECIDETHDFIFETMKPHGHYCVPILINEAIQGVIALYIEEGHRATELEIETLKAIASVVGGIIERKKMEDQLGDLVEGLKVTISDLDNEKSFNESVISNMASGLLILDNNGCVEKSNPAARQFISPIYGGNIGGKNLAEIFGPEAAELLTITKSVNNDLGRKEISIEPDDGRKKVFEYVAVAREDTSGLEQGIILNFSDITSYKNIQAEMEKMNRFSTIAEIASAVAHEVRNPLAGIMTMAQVIEEQLQDGDSKKEYIGRIIRQVDRLNVLLTDFFTYARPPRPRKEKVALVNIVDEIRPFMQNKMHKCAITFSEEYGENLPGIMVDSNQIQQVFLNLMLNSMDAIKQNGSIVLKTEYLERNCADFKYEQFLWLDINKNYVVVKFIDSGCGMSAEMVERVFEPFYTTKHNGTGLGMAIVFRILKENNASIHVASSEGEGTTYTIFFSVE